MSTVAPTIRARPTVATTVCVLATLLVVGAVLWRLVPESAKSDRQGWPIHEPKEAVRWLQTFASAIVQRDKRLESSRRGLEVIALHVNSRMREDHPERTNFHFDPTVLIDAYLSKPFPAVRVLEKSASLELRVGNGA